MNRHNPISKQAASCGIKPCSREENDALYVRVRQGDPAAKQRMIEGNMALVITRVAAYLREYPFLTYLRDDLISEGLLTLTDRVNELAKQPEREDPNPTGYLAASITRYINAFALEDHVIGAPRTMQNQIGRHIVPQVISLDTQDAWLPDKGKLPTVDPFQTVFLLEDIRDCCLDSRDHTIISMRLQGYRDHEIAEQLQCSRRLVSKLRQQIHRRYCQNADLSMKKRSAA